MDNFFQSIAADKAVARALACFSRQNAQSLVYGLAGAQKHAVLAAAYNRAPRPTAVITSGRDALEQLRADLEFLLPNVKILELPALDIITFAAAARSVELAAKRMDVLSRMIRGEPVIVLATAEAAIQKGLSRQAFESCRLSVAVGMRQEREQLLGNLVRLGYERVDKVDGIGQFSVRGDIVDVYPINNRRPVRLEFFGDEIDSAREFDAVSQRSLAGVAALDIMPLTQPDHEGKPAVFLSYLTDGATVVFDEPARIREHGAKLIKENPELKRSTFAWADLAVVAQNYNVLYFSLLLQKTPHTEPGELISVTARSLAPFHRQIDLLVAELKTWLEQKKRVLLLATTAEKAAAMQQSLSENGVNSIYSDAEPLADQRALIQVGALSGGFELPQAQVVVVTEKDIFGRQKRRTLPRAPKGEKIAYFRDINIGDYVVHANHGIGKYIGVETLDVGGIHKDYLHIRYAGQDKLFVPTDQVHLLQKYIGAEGEAPRLNKMGGGEWLKTKGRAEAAVADMAKELLHLYAERQVSQGFAFEKDTAWQREFEEAFSYEETPDQLTAAAEIKADMEKSQPMDRLLCGDVGFGKTEVAVRAAFKAVMSGKQVAILVPTTVLAQQHYQTFRDRFAGFGPTVDVVCRFRTPKEQRATLGKLAAGQVDILIGTHRILNADVRFKDLGLLIVDEEQRFGVAQKEKLKRFRNSIDVLTLSATPIPRTLHMSLAGARDMSIIETPPEERFPVQTYVVEYNDAVIRDAIKRELKRGGQVYFVYNRVETIDKMRRRLAEMLPDAKIQSAHGQMPEELLEQVMLDFYENRDDILVSTSIIENGLDVPNANTIIVYDADKFGLSQLYQMRGRVGRSHRMAFAYFTYRADKVLTEVAEKRLQAIKEFAELGAGFKIALRDLEIRGAGNLLGAQQHGHIASVGFEMYCRMLEEAVQQLKTGRPAKIPPEPLLELKVEAYLSGDYIGDAMHKIEIYQRIAAIRTEEHISLLIDELVDRFGDPPPPVVNLLTVARIKNMARDMGVKSVLQQMKRIEIAFGDEPRVDVDGILQLKEYFGANVTILPGPPPAIYLKINSFTARNILDYIQKSLRFLLAKS